MSSKLEELKNEYWKVLRRTRKSGRISSSVIANEEAYWGKYSEEVIIAALRVHIDRYPTYKEQYTRGIMRNMALQEQKTGSIKPKSQFSNYDQNKYDFEKLEKEMLAN